LRQPKAPLRCQTRILPDLLASAIRKINTEYYASLLRLDCTSVTRTRFYLGSKRSYS
jgi:hypothetical protein